MRREDTANVTDMTEWLQAALKKMDAMDAALHDMREELARRYYGEYLRHDSSFKTEAEKASGMVSSRNNGDRIPADEFEQWAARLRSSE